MTFTDRTETSQSERISLEFEFPHAPEKVWRALTEPALLAEWLLPAVGLKLERGAEFTFRTEPRGGWDGIVHCRIAEIDAPRKLTYDWGVGAMATVVTFTLTPTAEGTRMSLVQSGFRPDQRHNFGGARYGWKMMGGKLVDLLEKSL